MGFTFMPEFVVLLLLPVTNFLLPMLLLLRSWLLFFDSCSLLLVSWFLNFFSRRFFFFQYPFCMKCSFFINSLISVRTKIISLRLNQICRHFFACISIKICECT